MADEPPHDEADADRRATRTVADNPAGKVRFAQSGAVWEWNTRTGAFDVESTTMLLRRLDNPDLSLSDSSQPQRDLQISGEIARQESVRQAAASAAPGLGEVAKPAAASPPAGTSDADMESLPEPEDWALQTYVAQRTPGSAADAAAGGQTVEWSLRSGRGARRSEWPDKQRGYNPYGDDELPPPSRKR